MIRLLTFLTGMGMFLVGAASNIKSIPMPIDCTSIICSVGPAAFSLDVVLMVAGVFLIMVAWIFHRLAQ